MSPGTILFLAKLAPELRAALVDLVHALVDKDTAAERRALERARRLAFIARQRR